MHRGAACWKLLPCPVRAGRRRVVGEGAVDYSQRAGIAVDATAAIVRAVAGEGAVGDSQRAAVVDASTVIIGAVAGEGAVGDAQRAGVVDATDVSGPYCRRTVLFTASVPSLLMPPPEEAVPFCRVAWLTLRLPVPAT